MAHATTSVTSALPRVGLCAVTLPADGPSIHIFELDGGHLVAYDRNTWTAEVVEGLMRMHLGDYELVEPAKDGA